MGTNFRRQVKTLLKQKDMSVVALARQAKLKPQTIYNFLKKRSEMTSCNLARILDILSRP